MSQRARTLDIDDPEYFALPSLDQSQLKQFLKNPADWAFARLGGEESQPTDAMRFGTAFHAFLMGTGNVVSLDEGETYKSARNRQWRTEQEAAGNIVVSYSDLTLLKRMRSNIEKISGRDGYPDYMGMIQEGTCEQAIEWTDAATGLTLKAKPDLIPAGTDFLVDLKTAAAADEDSFSRSAFDHGYHIQAEFYRQAVALCPDGMFNRGTRVPKSVQFWVFEKTGGMRLAAFHDQRRKPDRGIRADQHPPSAHRHQPHGLFGSRGRLRRQGFGRHGREVDPRIRVRERGDARRQRAGRRL